MKKYFIFYKPTHEKGDYEISFSDEPLQETFSHSDFLICNEFNGSETEVKELCKKLDQAISIDENEMAEYFDSFIDDPSVGLYSPKFYDEDERYQFYFEYLLDESKEIIEKIRNCCVLFE